MADDIETGRSGLVGPGPTVDRPAGPTENWVGPAGPPLKYSQWAENVRWILTMNLNYIAYYARS